MRVKDLIEELQTCSPDALVSLDHGPMEGGVEEKTYFEDGIVGEIIGDVWSYQKINKVEFYHSTPHGFIHRTLRLYMKQGQYPLFDEWYAKHIKDEIESRKDERKEYWQKEFEIRRDRIINFLEEIKKDEK